MLSSSFNHLFSTTQKYTRDSDQRVLIYTRAALNYKCYSVVGHFNTEKTLPLILWKKLPHNFAMNYYKRIPNKRLYWFFEILDIYYFYSLPWTQFIDPHQVITWFPDPIHCSCINSWSLDCIVLNSSPLESWESPNFFYTHGLVLIVKNEMQALLWLCDHGGRTFTFRLLVFHSLSGYWYQNIKIKLM